MSPSPLFADISSNNSEFDAHAYRAAGHIFVSIKATEGTGYVNPDHRGWCYAAGGKHIGIAHYHYARDNSPEAEAAHFLANALPLAGGRDYLVLDGPGDSQNDPAWCRAFDQYVQQHSRFHTILYGTRSALSASDQWLHGDNRRIWEADWSNTPDQAPPGYHVVARQFTDGVYGPTPHGLPGVGQCDVSVLRGGFWQRVLRESR